MRHICKRVLCIVQKIVLYKLYKINILMFLNDFSLSLCSKKIVFQSEKIKMRIINI